MLPALILGGKGNVVSPFLCKVDPIIGAVPSNCEESAVLDANPKGAATFCKLGGTNTTCNLNICLHRMFVEVCDNSSTFSYFHIYHTLFKTKI